LNSLGCGEGQIGTLHDDLVAKGAHVRQPPTNYSWALEMRIEDSDGHVLRIGTAPNPNEPFAD